MSYISIQALLETEYRRKYRSPVDSRSDVEAVVLSNISKYYVHLYKSNRGETADWLRCQSEKRLWVKLFGIEGQPFPGVEPPSHQEIIESLPPRQTEEGAMQRARVLLHERSSSVDSIETHANFDFGDPGPVGTAGNFRFSTEFEATPDHLVHHVMKEDNLRPVQRSHHPVVDFEAGGDFSKARDDSYFQAQPPAPSSTPQQLAEDVQQQDSLPRLALTAPQPSEILQSEYSTPSPALTPQQPSQDSQQPLQSLAFAAAVQQAQHRFGHGKGINK